jgi:phage gp37-like protein
MTVRELIEELSKIKDQDVRVMVKGYEGGIDDAIIRKDENNTPAIYTIERNKNTEWYMGRHEVTEEDTPLKKDKIERAIILIG